MSVTIKAFVQAKGYTKGNAGRNAIVMHYVNGAGSSAKSVAEYFKNYGGASSHFVVGLQGEIYQCVNKHDTAYAVGTAGGTYIQKDPTLTNGTTISIELCHDKSGFRDATINSAVNLVKQLIAEYPTIKRVVRHYDCVNKVCPAFWVNDKAKDDDLHPVNNTEPSLIPEWVVFQAACLSEVLRVRKNWEDATSQVGAYVYPRNAIKAADTFHLNVYDDKGKLVYRGKGQDDYLNIRVNTTAVPFVKAIQIALQHKGYALPTRGVDGVMSSETRSALMRFSGSEKITASVLEKLFT